MAERMRYVNAAQTTLSNTINGVVTSMTVDDSSLFPTEGDFIVLVENEAVRVTAVASNVFTIVRGQEGSASTSHNAGVLVVSPLCESTLIEYAEQHSIYGSETPAFTITDPVTDLTAQVSDFTWVNQGGAVATDRDSNIFVQIPADAGDQFRGLFIAPPSTPYAIIMAWSHIGAGGGTGSASPFPQSELVFRESSTGEMLSIVFMPRSDATETPQRIQVKRMNSNTSFESSLFFQPWQFGNGPIWCKIEDDGTDLKFHVGVNGTDFLELFSQGRTAFMAGGPDQVGFGGNPSAENTYDIMLDVIHFGKASV